VDIAEGVAGRGVKVSVGVLVTVSLGCGVNDGIAEGKTTCVAAGTQAFKKRKTTKTNQQTFFIAGL